MAAIPVAIKDNIHVKGKKTTCASKFLTNYVAPFNATVTSLLENEDAIIIGKTNLDEFAMGSSTEKSALGSTSNPWDIERVPGGSSGGSAVAVAARLCPLSLGSDTGGSIRQPASLCGIFGFKPTYGRVSRYGLVAFGSSLDQVGPFATTSQDIGLIMEVLGQHCERDSTSIPHGPENYLEKIDTPLTGIKIGVPWQFLSKLAEEPKKTFEASLEVYKNLGATIVDVDLSLLKYSIAVYYILATAEASTNLARFDGVRYGVRSEKAETLREVYDLSKEEGFGAEVKRRILLGTYVLSSGYQDAYYRKAQKVRTLLIEQYKKAFENCDLIATPVTPFTAFKKNEIKDPVQMYLEDIYTISANLAGIPAISVPCGFSSEGLPLGIQLMAPQKHDTQLINAAYAFQKATDHYKKSAQNQCIRGINMSKYGDWEAVIGLEIHTELNTKSKLFSVAPNRFGDEPNTNITEVCTGQPGSLPVLNREVVEKAVRFGCAINGNVQKFSKFDRKSYFYPDSPRNFQITQFDEPIVLGGFVIAEVDGKEQTFEVNRVHIEDDAGMLKHFSKFAGVDYNRAGVPLIEIVSEPCIRTPREAASYAMAIKAILQYIDASDCNMEEGSLRFDANVSVRKVGETKLRNKIEIKNMNSFSFMELALEAEIKRQIKAYETNKDKSENEVIQQATYRWDPDKKTTVLMRRKEDADDYRYFPEPDLVPIILTDEYINKIKAALPELPLERERRYVNELNLSTHNAFILTSDKLLADYFEKALETCKNARNVCNWLIVEFAGRFKDSGHAIYNTPILPEQIADLVNMIDDGTINGKIAKSVADEMMLFPGKSPRTIVEENPNFQPMDNHEEIDGFVTKVLAENPQSIIDYKSGRDKALAFMVGQVMKLSKGKAPPDLVNKLIKEKI